MNLLDYLTEEGKIKQFLLSFPTKDWPEVVRSTLIYGINSMKAFESAGLYSICNAGSQTKRESRRMQSQVPKKKSVSRRKLSTDHTIIKHKNKKSKTKVKQDKENLQIRFTPKNRQAIKEIDDKFSARAFAHKEPPQKEIVPKRLQAMDLKFEEDFSINNSSDFAISFCEKQF